MAAVSVASGVSAGGDAGAGIWACCGSGGDVCGAARTDNEAGGEDSGAEGSGTGIDAAAGMGGVAEAAWVDGVRGACGGGDD